MESGIRISSGFIRISARKFILALLIALSSLPAWSDSSEVIKNLDNVWIPRSTLATKPTRTQIKQLLEIIEMGAGSELLEKTCLRLKINSAEDLVQFIELRRLGKSLHGAFLPDIRREESLLMPPGAEYKWGEDAKRSIRAAIWKKEYDVGSVHRVDLELAPKISIWVGNTRRETARTLAHELRHLVGQEPAEFEDILIYENLEAFLKTYIDKEIDSIEVDMSLFVALNKLKKAPQIPDYFSYFNENGKLIKRNQLLADLYSNPTITTHIEDTFYEYLQQSIERQAEDQSFFREQKQKVLLRLASLQKNIIALEFSAGLKSGLTSEEVTALKASKEQRVFYLELLRKMDIDERASEDRGLRLRTQFSQYLQIQR